jgi:para-nitrobenzyl esterase
MADEITRRVVAMLAAGLGAAALPNVALGKGRQVTSSPEAITRYGRVKGALNGTINVFRGIPYGASTAGANRFRAPQDPQPWSGLFDATRNGPQCPQPDALGAAGGASTGLAAIFGSGGTDVQSSEDCLRLNVFTPGCDKAGRAVMVWIHGGFYTSGSGNGALYDGSALARQEDVVVVAVTHRLNLFGYLYLGESAGPDFGQTPNAGQLDLVHALKWVRDNIDAFGGDPDRVTVFGESGGGRKIDVLMGMPAAKGLFRRAIVQSGPGVTVSSPDYQTQLADALLASLKIGRAEQQKLQNASVDALLEAHNAISRSELGRVVHPGYLMGGFTPVLDGVVIPAHPFTPAASPLAADVELLIGTNRDEQGLFQLLDPELRKGVDEALLEARVNRLLGSHASTVLAAYRTHMPSATPAERLRAIDTDRTYWINSVRIAERKSAQRPPVRMYRFDWATPAFEGRLGAHHGLEVGFAFNNLSAARTLVPDTQDNQRLADRMSRAWASFAKTGSPDQVGVPVWPAYDTGARRTMLINNEWSVAEDPRGFARELWSTLAP